MQEKLTLVDLAKVQAGRQHIGSKVSHGHAAVLLYGNHKEGRQAVQGVRPPAQRSTASLKVVYTSRTKSGMPEICSDLFLHSHVPNDTLCNFDFMQQDSHHR